jgi:PleD family two-component response regulator
MAFRNTGHVMGSERAKITVSIGCATQDAHTQFAQPADLVVAADKALYTAKIRGRNRSVPFNRQTMAAARPGLGIGI